MRLEKQKRETVKQYSYSYIHIYLLTYWEGSPSVQVLLFKGPSPTTKEKFYNRLK